MKKLIVLNPDDERTISSLMLRVPVVVSPTKSLLELLNTFQTGKSHLALVRYLLYRYLISLLMRALLAERCGPFSAFFFSCRVGCWCRWKAYIRLLLSGGSLKPSQLGLSLMRLSIY